MIFPKKSQLGCVPEALLNNALWYQVTAKCGAGMTDDGSGIVCDLEPKVVGGHGMKTVVVRG